MLCVIFYLDDRKERKLIIVMHVLFIFVICFRFSSMRIQWATYVICYYLKCASRPFCRGATVCDSQGTCNLDFPNCAISHPFSSSSKKNRHKVYWYSGDFMNVVNFYCCCWDVNNINLVMLPIYRVKKYKWHGQ